MTAGCTMSEQQSEQGGSGQKQGGGGQKQGGV
jgi:hypothetical protein